MSDVVERLRLAAKAEEIAEVWTLTVVKCGLLREAADEIERLRSQVAYLLPFAKSDAELGASVQRCGCDCADCEWYEQSVALLERVEAGEFAHGGG